MDSMYSRRRFLSAGALVAALGCPVPFARWLPEGVVPLALAQSAGDGPSYGKDGLTLLNDRPVNMETPAHLLDDAVTPGERLFVRNNGLPPDVAAASDESWFLEIAGEVDTPLRLSIAELKSRFEPVTLNLQMECGGNGRRFYSPGASGNQWTFGAIGCPAWTGVRLRDVLKAAGVRDNAVYTGHYGADRHLTGDPTKQALSRGVPIDKAMEPHTLIAWAINGANMPALNGHPLRLIAPGWPGSCSQKWLNRIELIDQVHDGAKMGGQSYRVPAYPVAPGTQVAEEDMVIIESMPVKSLTTFPKTGATRAVATPFEIRGHAWAGDRAVAAMDVSIDFGRSWQPARLDAPANRYAWQRWRAEIELPEAGYYEVWARAQDEAGEIQPPIPPGWNPRGYLNNMQHRIAVFAV